MGKISPVSGKYIVYATIEIDGTVEKPDVIGAIFGQTEGLLGADLELRELQRSGRIGRIEVNTTVKNGKVSGDITIPSSLDKAETAIIAAAMEVIERIGPCNAKIHVQKIEDVRISKRTQVIERAKELLRGMMDEVLPDSTEIAEAVNASVRMQEAVEYGEDKLPAGPAIDESEEIILVEGRADVMNLLKYGFKNVIAMNGSSVPKTIVELSKGKTLTVFVDGDRGGDLNTKELLAVAEIDFIARAPDGKEVEELTQKEIHKALRGKLTPDQAVAEMASRDTAKEHGNFSKRNYGPNNRPDNRVDNRRENNARPEGRPEMRSENRPEGRPENRPDERRDFRDRPDNRMRNGPDRRDPRMENRGDRPERQDRFEERPAFEKKKVLNETEKEAYNTSLQELLGTKGACLMDENANVLGKVPLSELDSTLSSLKGSVHAIAVDGNIDQNLARICDDARVKVAIGLTVVEGTRARASLISAEELSK
jgi:DNA primase